MTVTKHHLVVVLGKGYFTSENRAQTVVFGDILLPPEYNRP